MTRRLLAVFLAVAVATVCNAKADGRWMRKISQADRERINPFADHADAVKAGRTLFVNNCAKCHGEDAEGKGNRPSLVSARLRLATDGEIAWLLKNGNIYKGMPSWSGLPEQERWQLVAYVRSINPQAPGGTE